MIRTTALPAAVLLGLTLLAPTGATAAGETCQGQEATLVGSPQTTRLVGTEGRDVIVSNGSMTVEALGGDDLICVTGYGAQTFAGDGDDVVDATALTRFGAQVRLGAGSDRFTGSAGYDVVWTGAPVPMGFNQVDSEVDVVDVGPAPASRIVRDSVHSGQAGTPNADIVRMGRGVLEWAGIPATGAVADGGSGSTLAYSPAATESVVIDNVAGVLAVDQHAPLTFSGFTGFFLFAAEGPRAFTFRGSERDEQLGLELWDAARHTVRLGGGDDTARFYAPGDGSVPEGTAYAGGAGRDVLELTLPDEVDVDLDLARGRLSTGRKASEATVRAKGFEDSSVMAEDVELVGTAGRNELRVYACRSTVDGRGGRDKFSTFDEVMDEGLDCRRPRARFSGGGGNDVLTGSRGPDRLLGGPGATRSTGRRAATPARPRR